MPDALQSGQPQTVSSTARPAPTLSTRLGGLIAWWWKRPRRLDVAVLNDCMLRDVGLDRSVVDRDSTVSFWRLR
jgi:uncharacterized protein YjiS (DUF1127 family)